MRALLRSPLPSVEDVMTAWYGPPDLPAPAAALVTPGVPAALVDWFTVTDRWSQSARFAHMMSRPERVSIEDGKAAFWYENQAVWVWGYEPEGADPHVFDRENITNKPWTPSNMRLSVFLVRATVYEAVFGGPVGATASWVDRADVEQLLAPMNPLAGPAWNWPAPGFRLYAGDGLLAFAGPSPDHDESPASARGWSVFIGAREPGRLDYLSRASNVSWEQGPGER